MHNTSANVPLPIVFGMDEEIRSGHKWTYWIGIAFWRFRIFFQFITKQCALIKSIFLCFFKSKSKVYYYKRVMTVYRTISGTLDLNYQLFF
jgi:hypothetical protein